MGIAVPCSASVFVAEIIDVDPSQPVDETDCTVIRGAFHDNAALVFPGRAQEIQTPFFFNGHSIEVAARGQSRELVVKSCDFLGFAQPIHEPISPI